MTGSNYFEKYDRKADQLFDEGKYKEAITLLKPAYQEFPEQYFNISSDILMYYRELEEYNKCLEVITNGVRQGYFFSLQWEGWDPIRKIEGSESILAENERLKTEAQKKAQMRYEVHLPDGYSPEIHNPLFITMHCDGSKIGNIEWHRQFWKPDVMLQRNFIVVYIQSSQQISSQGFQWSEDADQRKKDIKNCYDQVTAAHSIDAQKVIVSGFSGGAMAAIETAIDKVFPVKGFIALGPDKPKNFSGEKVEQARLKGMRGVLMEGELTGSLSEIQEMESIFQQVGFPYQTYINKGIGHWYPDDLFSKLDNAITFISDR